MLISSSAVAKSPFTGLWGKENYNCGDGVPCSLTEIENGVAALVFEGLRLRVDGSRVCGAWYGNSIKIYRGFVVGRIVDGKLHLAYGQEIGHHPEFYEQTDFRQLPDFRAEGKAILWVNHDRLYVREKHMSSKSYATVFTKVLPSRRRYWGLNEAQMWESEFNLSCLAGANPVIENLRSGL